MNDSTQSDTRESEPDRGNEASDLPDHSPPRPRVNARVLRFAGLGTELAACTLAVAGIGYFVDSVRGHGKPYATALGTLIGFTLGMIRFIHQVGKG